jgi:hypothetical protein
MSYKEWEFEPNQMSFNHNGLNCLILRNPTFGFLNAYVFLPESNIYHGVDYDQVNSLFYKDLGVEITFGEYKGPRWAYGLSFSSIKDFIPNEPICEELDGIMESLKVMAGINITEKDYKNIEYAILKVQKLADLLNSKPKA